MRSLTKLQYVYVLSPKTWWGPSGTGRWRAFLITFVIRGSLEGQHPKQLYNVFAWYVIKPGVHMLTCGYVRHCFRALQHEELADVWQKLQTVAILK